MKAGAFAVVVTMLVGGLSVGAARADEDLTRYVDPFIGTEGTAHCFPNATVPFGLVQAGPVSGTGLWAYTGGYQFADRELFGFAQDAISGTGCCDLGDILIQPFVGEVPSDGFCRQAKADERASCGYYSVRYPAAGIRTEVTASEHVAQYRIRYGAGKPARLFLDLQWGTVSGGAQYDRLFAHVLSSEVDFPDDRTITGRNTVSEWVKRDFHYVIQFDRPVRRRVLLPKRHPNEKAGIWALDLDLGESETLGVKIALSARSVAGAKANLQAEAPGWDFDALRERARAKWGDILRRAVVTKGSDDQKTAFYTSLYHLCISPNNIADVGERPDYGTLSLWDSFRAAHPLYTLLVPERVPDLIESMMTDYRLNGFLPIWTLWDKDNQCMIGTHSVPVLVDAYLKGFPADWEKVYAAVRDTLRNAHANRDKERWDLIDRYGYYPFDVIRGESVSRLLECSYDDWCAAVLAERLGKAGDAAFFRRRSGNWRNVFDKSVGFVRGRDSKGAWRTPFDPRQLGHGATTANDFTEGNSWQYTWHVMQDPQGLIDAFGGPDQFVAKLDSLFTSSDEMPESEKGKSLDVTGLIGQYAHGNEPSHHIAYFYPFAGRPRRTAEVVREVFDRFYLNKPDGLSGNDDCGQMSAWYVFGAMGFYPFNPCGGDYVLGAPQIPEIELRPADGKVFRVVARNLTRENKYVKSMTLGGKPLDGFVLKHADIVKGGELVFEMGR